MGDPLISIIVPIYNVEKYIKECVYSIIKQTYTNLEIILVDDGSPDNCPQICDEFEKLDSRIKVIHKQNGGLSSARNAGLDICNGEYVAFVDSDDIISVHYIEFLYMMCKKTSSEISECYFYCFDNYEDILDINNEYFNIEDCIIYLGHDMELNLYGEDSTQHVIVCNKLYKTSLFKNIRFPNGKIHEDEFTSYKLYNVCNTVCVSKTSLYYYRKNDQSITHKAFSTKKFDALTAFEERLDFYKEKNDNELYKKVIAKYHNLLKRYYFMALDSNDEEAINILVNKMRANVSNLSITEIGIKKYLKYYALAYFPNGYCKLKNIKKKMTNKRGKNE